MPDFGTISETLRTPVTAEYDVIVSGGGASGLIAAVSAAGEGARTAVIERSGCFGGTGTSAMVAQWLGFHNGEMRVVGGLGLELTKRVCALGGSKGFTPYVFGEAGRKPIPLLHFAFNPEIVKIACDEFANDAGIDIYFHTQIARPIVGDGRVGGIIIENASGRSALRSKIVIDATGDATIASASGVPCMGEEAELRKKRQPCALLFRLSNVDVKRFRSLPRDEKRAIAVEGVREGRLHWESLAFLSTPAGTDAICMMSRIYDIDALNAADLTRAELVGRQQIKGIVEFLQERVPGFEKSVLATIAERIGIRETRRIVGQYKLEESDILEESRFPDSVALAAGPVSLHQSDGSSVNNIYMPDVAFEIPLRCMLPKTMEGIVVTGRAICASREANGGARNMGTAMALGDAAGVYAARYAQGKSTLTEPAADEIRKTLRARSGLVSIDDAVAISKEEGAEIATSDY